MLNILLSKKGTNILNTASPLDHEMIDVKIG